jgi:hypothetical protein
MVTAVLLMSIALSVGSSYILDHGDNIGKEEDLIHASDVENSFLMTRASMNSLLRAEDTMTVIVERFTLGTYGNPYLAVARSSGSLTIDPDPLEFQISVFVESVGSERELNSVNGALIFASNNYYYHDQDLYFTAGSVILEQYGSEVMTAVPDIQLVDNLGDLQIHMGLYGITSSYSKIAGIESLPISIRMAGNSLIEENILPGESLSIRINGLGEKAWYDHMRTFLSSNGLTDGVDFTITAPADWNDPNDYVEIDMGTVDTVIMNIGEMEVTM